MFISAIYVHFRNGADGADIRSIDAALHGPDDRRTGTAQPERRLLSL